MNAAIEALLEIGRYNGPHEALLNESVRVIQCALGCSAEQAQQILDELREQGLIQTRISPMGGEIPSSGMQLAGFEWFVPETGTQI